MFDTAQGTKMDRLQLAVSQLTTFCADDKNKPFVMYVVLACWTLMNVTFIGILAITGGGASVAAFYIPLMIYIPSLSLLTNLLLRCAFEARVVMAANPRAFGEKASDWAEVHDTVSIHEQQ